MIHVRTRRWLEADEDRRLAAYAMRSNEAVRRYSIEDEQAEDLRLAYQRDRDRVLHARAFRRLKHKTQVFVPHVADHPRTRLTHTLEVGQLGRSVARALGLNEDLVEAIAMAHDLGHTAFGHSGETTLDRILHGLEPAVGLPDKVVENVGAFKHNYQSLRVVDLLERRYQHPGLNLTDQVREGILKHTRWQVSYPFPLPNRDGLALDEPCHLEGQAVAVGDEIAQQTHDLEDGLRAGSVELADLEGLEAVARVVSTLGPEWRDEPSRSRREHLLIRGLIRLFVVDVVDNSGGRLRTFAGRHGLADDRMAWQDRARELSHTTVWFSADVEQVFLALKDFIYRFIINHSRVNRQDWRARKVVTALFHAFWFNPLNLPDYVLLRARDELGYPYLRELPLAAIAPEVEGRYHCDPGFARLVADHIAGMSDRFALEEYCSLEQPSPGQRFPGDLQ
jgi:dGTPase